MRSDPPLAVAPEGRRPGGWTPREVDRSSESSTNWALVCPSPVPPMAPNANRTHGFARDRCHGSRVRDVTQLSFGRTRRFTELDLFVGHEKAQVSHRPAPGAITPKNSLM